MMPLASPRHPLIDQALADARRWCAGRIIDQRPAVGHAVMVALVTAEHQPAVTPTQIVASLLHDAPEFAPADLDLDAYLTATYGADVTRVIRAVEQEHQDLEHDDPPIRTDDPAVVLLSTADKIVAMRSMVARSRRSPHATVFFLDRRAFLRLIPYFHAWACTVRGLVPDSMANELDRVMRIVDASTAEARRIVETRTR